MVLRAAASPAASGGAGPAGANRENPAYAPHFAVSACELSLPANAAPRALRVGGQALAVTVGDPKRIVVLGDTGCRVKVAADGRGDPVQDCSDPTAWPWARIAAAARREAPDLVIHVGDFHYREYCEHPVRCAALKAAGAIVDYGWAGWNADFFEPAAPLLAAAPWIMVRGNHENCDRAGEGWMRFLSPMPYTACPDQRYRSATRSVLGNNLTAPAFRVDAGPVSIVVADNAGHEDYRKVGYSADDPAIFARDLKALYEAPTGHLLWLLSHRPLWYDLLAPSVEPNDFQNAVKGRHGERIDLSISGHQHGFATYNFAADADRAAYPAGRPAQLIVGGGGTQLEALDPGSQFFEGIDGPGSRERAVPGKRLYEGVAAASGIVLNRYSFMVLDRAGAGWDARVVDPEGRTITRCRIDDGRKELVCPFPGR
jgi:hypothetical protein